MKRLLPFRLPEGEKLIGRAKPPSFAWFGRDSLLPYRNSGGNPKSGNNVALSRNACYAELRFSNRGEILDGRSFVEACLSHPAVDRPNPQPEATPGNPSDLFANMYYPCDICVGKEAKHIHRQAGFEHIDYDIDEHLATIFTSVERADCDATTSGSSAV